MSKLITGLTKIVPPGAQEFVEIQTQLVKFASGGLRGNDLNAFVKRAGIKMADMINKLSFAPGEVAAHLIALGAHEYFGFNRNGDTFTEEACKKYHDTFVKHAYWYHNHQNKDPRKSYGTVKYAGYNENMHRIELIVAFNGTKQAAERNKGLLASEELQALESGKEIPVSMACKVAYDVCSVCGNKARTRDDYCMSIKEGGSCAGGGCKNNLCKVAEDGTATFVYNPKPDWFDISKVFRPADRIAYVFGKVKTATDRVMGGAEIANEMNISAPIDVALDYISDTKLKEQVKIAHKLADIENKIIFQTTPLDSYMAIEGIHKFGTDKKTRAYALTALAKQKIAMSLTDFIQFASSCDRDRAVKLAHEVRPYISNIFNDLCSDVETLAYDLSQNPFEHTSLTPPAEITRWAEKQAMNASISIIPITHRIWTNTIRGDIARIEYIKKAEVANEACEKVARAYGLYKIALLYNIRNNDPNLELTSTLLVRQNHI